MLTDYLDTVRSSSIEARRRFALVFAVGATIAIVFIYILFSMAMRYATPEAEVAQAEPEEGKRSLTDVFRGANTFISEQLGSMPATSSNAAITEQQDTAVPELTFDPNSFDPASFDPYISTDTGEGDATLDVMPTSTETSSIDAPGTTTVPDTRGTSTTP